MFLSDGQIRSYLCTRVIDRSSQMHPIVGVADYSQLRQMYCIAGASAAFTKTISMNVSDGPTLSAFHNVDPAVFDRDNNKVNTIYHMMTRMTLFDEIVQCAAYLPKMSEDFLAELKKAGNCITAWKQFLDSEFADYYMRIHCNAQRHTLTDEHYKGTITEPFVEINVGKILRACETIMINAIQHLKDEEFQANIMAGHVLIVTCEYLERLGITPTTAEGIVENGDVWFNLSTGRRRDVGAVVKWWDHYTKQDVITLVPFHVDGVKED